MVLFREPVKRIVSHRNYMHALGAGRDTKAVAAAAEKGAGRAGATAGGAYSMAGMPLETMEGFVGVAPMVTNDFYVRILNGEAVYRLPRFNITMQHLEVGE